MSTKIFNAYRTAPGEPRSGTRLLAHVPGTRDLEYNLKTRFRSERIEGEWFAAGGDLEATIGHLVALQSTSHHGTRTPQPGGDSACPA